MQYPVSTQLMTSEAKTQCSPAPCLHPVHVHTDDLVPTGMGVPIQPAIFTPSRPG